MAYTYGANIQSNPNAAYNLWGSTGPSNPYITQGPGYTPGSYPTNQQQQASLLPMTNNVPRPGFNDTDGTPMHMSSAFRPDGTNEHTSSFYFNQAQKPGQSVNEWKNMSPHEKAQIHENAARLAAEAGDTFSARRSMDVAERLRAGTPDWANPEGGYQGLGPWNYGDEGEYVAPGEGDYKIIPGNERGLLNNIDQESISNIFDWINPLGILSKADDINIPNLITNFVQSKFNANKQSTPAQVTAPVANAFNPYVGYEAAPAPANNEDGYGGYASPAAHAAAQAVIDDESFGEPGQHWYI